MSIKKPRINISLSPFYGDFIEIPPLTKTSINKFECTLSHGGFVDKKEGKIFLTLLFKTKKQQANIITRLKNFKLSGANNIITFFIDHKNKISIQHCMPLNWKTEKNHIAVEFFFCKDEKELKEYLLKYGVTEKQIL